MNLNASDYAVKSGEFSMGGGESGPSVEDLMKTWEVNEKKEKQKEKRHFSLWTLIKRTFWTIIFFVIAFIIVVIVCKLVELWKLKNWAMKTGRKIKKLYDERENLFGLVRDNVAHLKRLSHVVLGGGRVANTIEPAAPEEEVVRLRPVRFGRRACKELLV